MEIYKFKCDCCGSTSCDKIDDTTYKCIFCGKEQRIFVDTPKNKDEEYLSGEQVSDNSGEKNDNVSPASIDYRNFYQTNKPLIILLSCLFFGYFGVHKFLQGKIVMGIVYFLTGGIFCFGWIIDIIKCAIECWNDSKKNKN